MPARIIIFSNTSENLEFGGQLEWVYVSLSWDFWGWEEQRILYETACAMLRFYLSWELSVENVQKYGDEG